MCGCLGQFFTDQIESNQCERAFSVDIDNGSTNRYAHGKAPRHEHEHEYE